MRDAVRTPIRCAIYTRKSTDEGLDQSFNSLDAQREACEAYVRSQCGEGWVLIPDCYDDGGFSGGSLDRPAMQQLLADVDAGRIDVIIVYKVDRLTRSLMDFARIVDRLDAHNVSFVSVTQAFNTTTSMGRLTLNVLLSFAQFEREVTGERIRDKIAASKAKGIWMGGNLPLGYDLGQRVLVVNEAEAEEVRYIFRRYRDLGSAVALMRDLKDAGIVSKRWVSRSGNERGGSPLSCGALYYLLQNRLYLGEIVHRGERHTGEHEPIIDRELFDAVQEVLASNRRQRRSTRSRATRCHFAGRIFDVDGQPMGTSFSYGRGGRLYRYYVSGSLDPSARKGIVGRRIPAGGIETLILRTVGQLAPNQAQDALLQMIRRVQLNSEAIHCVIDPSSLVEPLESLSRCQNRLAARLNDAELNVECDALLLTLARRPQFRGGATSGGPAGWTEDNAADVRRLLKQAHKLLREHALSPLHPAGHGEARAPAGQRQRHLMALGLLSPKIQRRVLSKGAACSLREFQRMPLAWADQEALYLK